MPAAANREGEFARPGEGQSAAHVGGSPTIGDDGGSFVDRPVPDPPRAIVVLALRGDEATPETPPQLCCVELWGRLNRLSPVIRISTSSFKTRSIKEENAPPIPDGCPGDYPWVNVPRGRPGVIGDRKKVKYRDVQMGTGDAVASSGLPGDR